MNTFVSTFTFNRSCTKSAFRARWDINVLTGANKKVSIKRGNANELAARTLARPSMEYRVVGVLSATLSFLSVREGLPVTRVLPCGVVRTGDGFVASKGGTL